MGSQMQPALVVLRSPLPEPAARIIQILIFLREAETQEVLASTGPEESRSRNGRNSCLRQQRASLLCGLGSRDPAYIRENVICAGRDIRRKSGISQSRDQPVAS